MEISQIIPHIEALIFASDKPLSSAEITELVNNAMGFIEDRATQEQVDAALEGICEKYNAEFYPFEVKESGGGWQFLTKKAYYKTVGQLNGDKFLKRLSNAALETLAIIAYKQPITKSEIEAIRGVNCDYAVQKLLEKDLIVITGRREDAVGHPLLYATSKSFMDYFGINSAEELPKISEVMMDELVQATMVNQQQAETEEGEENNTDIPTTDIPTPVTDEATVVVEEGEIMEAEEDAPQTIEPSTNEEDNTDPRIVIGSDEEVEVAEIAAEEEVLPETEVEPSVSEEAEEEPAVDEETTENDSNNEEGKA